SKKDIQLFKNGTKPKTHANSDWTEATLRKFAPQNHISIAGQGGTDKVQYFISGDYDHKGSLFRGGDMYYDKYQIRSRVNAQVMKYLEVGIDLSGRLKRIHQPVLGATAIFHRIQLSLPTSPIRYPNGDPGFGST